MNYERLVLKIKVSEFEPDILSGEPDSVISFIADIKAKYKEQGHVYIEAENDSYYNGCTHFSVYVSRHQTDDEYNLMVAEKEAQRMEENSNKAQRIISKKLKGKNLTAKEIKFLKDIGILLS
ncbi:hypothetical protein ACTOJ1_000447 [Shigella flexneri]